MHFYLHIPKQGAKLQLKKIIVEKCHKGTHKKSNLSQAL